MKDCDELLADIKTLVLRLMGEDESTFAPETMEVMGRWRDKVSKDVIRKEG